MKRLRGIKQEILDKSNHQCQACGTELNNSDAYINHIQPLSQGGQTEMQNLQVLCASCHRKIDKALNNKKWDYRTVKGIAKEVNMNEEFVRSILTNPKSNVRESFATSRKGEKLYTLKSRKSFFSDIWTSVQKLSNDKFGATE